MGRAGQASRSPRRLLDMRGCMRLGARSGKWGGERVAETSPAERWFRPGRVVL